MTETQRKEPVIALLGQPNSGKSTLFNGLTGLKQHVGNWPGKTVEQKEGYFVRSNQRYTVVDLPGTYSLSANSEEEIITRDYIAEGNADAVCILADASQLERSLFMLADFAGIRTPAFLLLNMMDVAKDQGKTIDPQRLEKKTGNSRGGIFGYRCQTLRWILQGARPGSAGPAAAGYLGPGAGVSEEGGIYRD